AVESMDLSLSDAIQMVSLTPANLLGVAGCKGSLEPNKDADITVLDSSLHVKNTVIAGRIMDLNKDFRMEKGGEYGWRMVL
ncbi:MAG: amidohydrolase family protein, partial [Spirochaetaceae bacterium]|nr:amidohydrolase family protein [Spirochaetaceae bacterium]